MRSIHIMGLVGLTILASVSSCKNDLENVPIEQQTLDQVFDKQDSAGVNANRFLADCYRYLPSNGNRLGGDFLDAATDDALSSSPTLSAVQQLATGAYTADSYQDNQWASLYQGIRSTTLFITNIDRVPLKGKIENGTPMNRVWKAEARFLRAMFYFELVKRHVIAPLFAENTFPVARDEDIRKLRFKLKLVEINQS